MEDLTTVPYMRGHSGTTRGKTKPGAVPTPSNLWDATGELFDDIISENRRPDSWTGSQLAQHEGHDQGLGVPGGHSRKPLKSLSTFFPDFFEAAKSVTNIERRPKKPVENAKLEEFFPSINSVSSASPLVRTLFRQGYLG